MISNYLILLMYKYVHFVFTKTNLNVHFVTNSKKFTRNIFDRNQQKSFVVDCVGHLLVFEWPVLYYFGEQNHTYPFFCSHLNNCLLKIIEVWTVCIDYHQFSVRARGCYLLFNIAELTRFGVQVIRFLVFRGWTI